MSKEGAPESMPFVVVFYYDGAELRARIRDVRSQEQRVLHEAGALWRLLVSAWGEKAGGRAGE